MKMDFSVESMQDAVLARAALDGLLGAYSRNQSPAVIQNSIVDIVADKVTAAVKDRPKTVSIDVEAETETDAEDTADADETETNSATNTSTRAGAASASSGGFTKDQIRQAAAHDTKLAELVQGRGRKSAAVHAEIARRTAAALGLPLPSETPVGAALSGATAAQLNAALNASTTVVHQEPGIEVRTLSQDGPSTILEARISSDDAQPVIATPSTLPAGSNPIAGDSSLAELLASRKAAQVATPVAGPVVTETAVTLPPTPPLADDAEYQQGKKPLDQMTHEELFQAIRDYSDQGAGLFWFRAVVERSKAGDQSKMPVEYMREVLANPGAFYPNGV